jgi:hypothetical protein
MKARLCVRLMLLVCAAAAGCSVAEYSPPPERDPETDLRATAAELAAFDEAQELIAGQRYAEAQARLSPLPPAFARAGDTDRASRSLFWLGFCHEKQDRPQTASDLYTQVIQRYPDTPAERQAATRLAALAPKPQAPPSEKP